MGRPRAIGNDTVVKRVSFFTQTWAGLGLLLATHLRAVGNDTFVKRVSLSTQTWAGLGPLLATQLLSVYS